MKKDERCVTSLPISFSKGNVPEFAEQIVGAGETALLGVPQLGLLSSSECHGQVLLETLNLVPQLVKADRVIISAFGADTSRVTRESAIKRNESVIALSTEVVDPYISKGSPLEKLLSEHNS